MGERDAEAVARLGKTKEEIYHEIGKVIVGQRDVIEQLLVALLAGGHCLLVGVPGLAKTTLIQTLAQTLDLSFGRIQFTPDLMPSDITGTEILEEDLESGRKTFRFVQGPIFAHIILADEITHTLNREILSTGQIFPCPDGIRYERKRSQYVGTKSRRPQVSLIPHSPVAGDHWHKSRVMREIHRSIMIGFSNFRFRERFQWQPQGTMKLIDTEHRHNYT